MSAPTEIHMHWGGTPYTSLTITCNRVLTADEIHAVGEVVEEIETMRLAIETQEIAP